MKPDFAAIDLSRPWREFLQRQGLGMLLQVLLRIA
jgi:hypothetical protein